MAKGQVSEEQLSQGLKGIGNFDGLSAPRVRRDNPFRDSRKDVPQLEPTNSVVQVQSSPTRAREPELKPVPAKGARANSPSAKPAAKVPKREEKPGDGGLRKADIFKERVTLMISPEMRDDVERIARELQRSKSSKAERITGNTVMRVAIRLLTEKFELKGNTAPNNEEELFEVVAKALRNRAG
jgi:hypothetical protein